MRTLRLLYHMARADFLERARRPAFLFTLAVAIYAAHGFLPPDGSAYVTMQIGGWRGLYNSAWVGVVVALLASTFLSLAGFYLVKNAVTRDRATRVGEILAATPLSRPAYTLGKTLSNFLVLAAMTAVMAAAAGVVQVLRAEETRIELWPLLAPFVFLTLPAMLLTAAVAVLFETIPFLRGGGGNIAWFFLWVFLLAATGASQEAFREPARDWLGRGTVVPDMVGAAAHANPAFDPDSTGMTFGLTFRDGGWDVETFRWEGPRWTAGAIAGRLMWVVVALGVAVGAALPFDRFDPSRGSEAARSRRRREPFWKRWMRERPPEARGVAAEAAHLPPAVRAGRGRVSAFATVLRAEWRLALRDQGAWWWLVFIGLAIAGLFTPLEVARGRILPLLWVWPILVWSPLGTRERRHGVDQILFSAPHPLATQLAASWAAGFLLAAAAGAPVGLRLALAGDGATLFAWAIGAAFIPALALALGVWSGTPRTFEAIYIVWWYMGPLQHIAPLDFMGASREAVAAGAPIAYAAAAVALGVAATYGRAVRLRT